MSSENFTNIIRVKSEEPEEQENQVDLSAIGDYFESLKRNQAPDLVSDCLLKISTALISRFNLNQEDFDELFHYFEELISTVIKTSPKNCDPDEYSKQVVDTVKTQYQWQEPEQLRLKKSLDIAMRHLDDMRNLIYSNNWTVEDYSTPTVSQEQGNSNIQPPTPSGSSATEWRNTVRTNYDETLPPPELQEDTLENLLSSHPEVLEKINRGELLNSCDRRVLGKQIFSRLCKYCRIPYDPSKKEKRIYFRHIFGSDNVSVPESLYISSTAGTRGYFDTYCMNSKATIKCQLEGTSRKHKRKINPEETKSSKIRLEAEYPGPS